MSGLLSATLPTLALLGLFALAACKRNQPDAQPDPGRLVLLSALVGAYGLDLQVPSANAAAPADTLVRLTFSAPLDTAASRAAMAVRRADGTALPVQVRFSQGATAAVVALPAKPAEGQGFTVALGNGIRGQAGETFAGATLGFTTAIAALQLDSVQLNGRRFSPGRPLYDVPATGAQFRFFFNKPLQPATATASAVAIGGPGQGTPTVTLEPGNRVLRVATSAPLGSLRGYTVQIWGNSLKGLLNEAFPGFRQQFFSRLDTTDKFPRIPDEQLLTLVQERTFRYFYDYAEPNSGLARERNANDDIVTTGGSGFGLMAIIVGADRGFISRAQAVAHFDKVTRFLARADRFHGVWPHWLHGATGRVRPFSPNDDGGDLVETAFLAQGLITVRQYLNRAEPVEASVATRIDELLDGIEWDWHRRGGQQVLYWHWSPRVGWAMNFPLRGWNETLITYVLAASSRTHGIPRSVYEQGYCTGSEYRNGRTYYGVQLPLGPDRGKGGPMFFAHYSFLGLDPRRLADANANYMVQNTAHTQINYRYCVANPRGYLLYGPNCWGLTASDNYQGYNAHDPDNDLGVITPTAALGSMPYAPDEAMRALRFFYYKMGDRLWGPYGFYDAFAPNQDWVASSYLAIDQGPIVVMIENYRTQRLWSLFMSAPEVQQGLQRLGFTY